MPTRRQPFASSSPRLLLATALLLLAVLIPAVPAHATVQPPPLLRQFCDTGSGAGQCVIPRGIAADPTSGDIYVADQVGRRIEKFTAWGDFLRTWGWDVVAEGPDDAGTGFEVCVPATGDVCKGGLSGGGAGQLDTPQGLALDSSGDLFVTDFNERVAKFTHDGEFLLTFGGEVNRTEVALREEQEAKAEPVTVTEAQENLCIAASGDVCRAGTKGTGKGQFEASFILGSYVAVDTNLTATTSDDTVYVGDQGRVQRFDPEGHYLADLPDPEGMLEGETVNSLAVDPASGDLYTGFTAHFPSANASSPDLHKLSPTGAELCTIDAHDPTAVAVAADGSVYVVDGVASTKAREISRFNSGCAGKESALRKGTRQHRRHQPVLHRFGLQQPHRHRHQLRLRDRGHRPPHLQPRSVRLLRQAIRPPAPGSRPALQQTRRGPALDRILLRDLGWLRRRLRQGPHRPQLLARHRLPRRLRHRAVHRRRRLEWLLRHRPTRLRRPPIDRNGRLRRPRDQIPLPRLLPTAHPRHRLRVPLLRPLKRRRPHRRPARHLPHLPAARPRQGRLPQPGLPRRPLRRPPRLPRL